MNLSLRRKISTFKCIRILVIFLFITSICEGQIKYNFRTFENDFKQIAKQPGNWDENDWLKLLGGSSISYGMMYLDRDIQKLVLENNSYKKSFGIEFGRIWGEPVTTLIFAGSFYAHGTAFDNKSNKKLGFEIAEAAFYSTVITILLKFSFGRERPRQTSDPFSFHPFSFNGDNFLSFSSGHTVLGFSLSTVLAKNTDNDLLKIAYYIPGFLTAFSRVYQNHHWASDVIFGALLGYTIAEFVVKLHAGKNNEMSRNPSLEKPVNLFNFKIPF